MRLHFFKHRKDGGQKMGGRYKVYILSSLFLQLKHDLIKPFPGYLPALSFLADVIVLTVAAAKGTSGEKYGSAPSLPGKTGFLPEMKGGPGRFYRSALAAYSGRNSPVCPASSGAELTIFI